MGEKEIVKITPDAAILKENRYRNWLCDIADALHVRCQTKIFIENSYCQLKLRENNKHE